MGKKTNTLIAARERAAKALLDITAERAARDERIAAAFTAVFLTQTQTETITAACGQAVDAATAALDATDETMPEVVAVMTRLRADAQAAADIAAKAATLTLGAAIATLTADGVTTSQIGAHTQLTPTEIRRILKTHTDQHTGGSKRALAGAGEKPSADTAA